MSDRAVIQGKILELCAEDDYGGWELWWAVAPSTDASESTALLHAFVDAIVGLVADQLLDAKTRTASRSGMQVVSLDPSLLTEQLMKSRAPHPDFDYWFGAR